MELLEEILRSAESCGTPQCVEYTYNGTYLVLTYDSGKTMLIELNYDHDLLWLYPHFHYDYGPGVDDDDGKAMMLALFGLDQWPRGG